MPPSDGGGDYRTERGRRPVKEFITGLSDTDAAAVIAGMKDVETNGLAVAKHVRGEIYEVVAAGDHQTFRVLFAREGEHHRVLLALEAFSKKTRKTSPTSSNWLSVAWQTGETVSTVERYAAAVGKRVEWRLIDAH